MGLPLALAIGSTAISFMGSMSAARAARSICWRAADNPTKLYVLPSLFRSQQKYVLCLLCAISLMEICSSPPPLATERLSLEYELKGSSPSLLLSIFWSMMQFFFRKDFRSRLHASTSYFPSLSGRHQSRTFKQLSYHLSLF